MLPEELSARLGWERKFQARGHLRVAGLDEAGRGPWAGPVVAAAVILPAAFEFDLPIVDSKKLAPRRREQVFSALAALEGIEVGVGRVDAEEIDRINILRATRRAMEAALSSLASPPAALLIDGLTLPAWARLPQEALCRGEDQSVSIAAASIVAKVTRDRIMVDYDRVYPGYGFAGHKGYGTAAHRAALERLGPCPIHRRSFRPVARFL